MQPSDHPRPVALAAEDAPVSWVLFVVAWLAGFGGTASVALVVDVVRGALIWQGLVTP